MLNLFPKRYARPGTAPGTLSLPAIKRHAPTITVMDYSESELIERHDATLEECAGFFVSPNVTWLHVQGDPDAMLLEALADAYRLHPLAVEDIVNTGQRSKVEAYQDQTFVVLPLPIASDGGFTVEQVSLFLGPRYVVSFCSGGEDIFAGVRKRLRVSDSGRIRRMGADYLLYALIDTVIDHGFPLMEQISERLEEIEERVLLAPGREALDDLHRIKRELLVLRRMLWPQREVVNALLRDEHAQVEEQARIFFRDCYDHSIQIIELVESYRELASSIMDVYLTSLSNRMNDVMKVLTIIATIFIPLSFIVGLYGMNFNPDVSPWNMPELSWYFGYPVLLALLVLIALLMLWQFRRRDWF